MKSVLIAVLTWNNGNELIRCLQSLAPYKIRYDLLLVDNASSDHSVSKVRQRFPDVVIEQNTVNSGAAGGYNICLAYARRMNYKYLILVDGDMVLESLNLEEFEKFLDNHSEASAVCPKIKFGDANLLWSAGGHLLPMLVRAAVIGHKQPDGPKFDRTHPVDFSPNPWMLRLNAISRDVLFSTDYGRYGFEDVDFFYNLRKKNGSLWYLPTVIFSQNPRISPTRNHANYYYWITRNRILFAKKHLSPFAFLLIFTPYFFLRKFMLETLLFLVTGRFAIALGIAKGIIWHFSSQKIKTTLDKLAS